MTKTIRALNPARHGLGLIWALLIVMLAVSAGAEEKRVPRSVAEIKLSFAPIVKKVAPAVVNIYTKRIVQTRPISPFFNDPYFRRFFGRNFRGLPRKRVLGSLGSGVIVRADGVIITNAHVIKGAQQITVVTADRWEYEAKVLLRDPRTDLAVLRIKAKSRLPVLILGDADELEVGDLVLAVGNPFGVGQTVTSGIVSAVSRTSVGITDYRSFIQTDAAINPGNSGGALVSLDGKLVGINTAIYSKSGGSVGIGFAIPSSMVKSVLRSALTGKALMRPWIGAQGQDVTPDIALSLGLEKVGGIIMSDIDVGGPADKAGLKNGDVVTAINGRALINGQSLRFRLALLRIGGKASLTVYRAGKKRQVEVTLIAPPEVPLRNVTTLSGTSPFAGATVANLSPLLAYELGAGAPNKGVIILKVELGSPAHRLRMAPGDLVIHVNGHDIKRVAGLRSLTDRRSNRWLVRLRRRGQVLTLRLGG
ncbi:MAG: Do family serine endopeptidase [Alphaproteobacteria bacterium]|nr:Do family serine endopeptidase [Alphaproteobacteria bacterium]